MGSWCTVLRASCYFGRLNESLLHREAAQHVKGHGLAWFEVRVSERHEMLRNEDSSTALNIEEDSEISVKMDDSFDRNQLLEVLAQSTICLPVGKRRTQPTTRRRLAQTRQSVVWTRHVHVEVPKAPILVDCTASFGHLRSRRQP